MATRLPPPENAGTPLSSAELARDRAASPQDTDPLDRSDPGNTSLPASESHLLNDPDEDHGNPIEADITLLPPG